MATENKSSNPFTGLLFAIMGIAALGLPVLYILKGESSSNPNVTNSANVPYTKYSIDGFNVSEWVTHHGMKCVLAAGTVACIKEN